MANKTWFDPSVLDNGAECHRVSDYQAQRKKFKREVGIILVNMMVPALEDLADKIFTRDLFGSN